MQQRLVGHRRLAAGEGVDHGRQPVDDPRQETFHTRPGWLHRAFCRMAELGERREPQHAPGALEGVQLPAHLARRRGILVDPWHQGGELLQPPAGLAHEERDEVGEVRVNHGPPSQRRGERGARGATGAEQTEAGKGLHLDRSADPRACPQPRQTG